MLRSQGVPAGSGIGAGVSPVYLVVADLLEDRQSVSLVKADFLGDKQAVGDGRGAGKPDLLWMELFGFKKNERHWRD